MVRAVLRAGAGEIAGCVAPAVDAVADALIVADAVIMTRGLHFTEDVACFAVIMGVTFADTIHTGTVNASLLRTVVHGTSFRVLYVWITNTLKSLGIALAMTRTLHHGILCNF